MNKKNIKDAIKTAKYMLSFVFKKKGGKMYFFLKMCVAVIDAFIPLVYVILPGLIINELLQGQRIMLIIFYILTLCLMPIFNEVMRQLMSGDKIPCINRDSIIEFRNVSFRYPGSDKYALNGLNLTLNLSEKLCIVGRNGSGKSTFIKLLTRLYFPTEGEILLDGININEYDYRQYQALFSPVFQDFQLYFMSLRKNICLNNQVDEILLKKTYDDSFLNKLIDTLPYFDETQVYKWECSDGFEPSGGEAQRIAIARALYRNGEIFLLDEPTAALDPDAEYEIYTQFHNMINGKCAVFITHRLSAVQLADKVAVFDDGHVAEYGTHSELYSKGGIYTEMFDKQAQFYRDAPSGEVNTGDTHDG